MGFKKAWNKLSPFVKGGIVGAIFALLLFLFDLHLSNYNFKLGNLYIFYFINLLKHFVIFGLFWNFFVKLRTFYNKKKLIIISIVGGIVGILIMFFLQARSLSLIESIIDNYLGDMLLGLIYPPPFFLVAWGIVIISPITLISNALIGMSISYYLAYLKKNNIKNKK